MGEGWSENKGLIPSNEPVNHPDPRMHWKIGVGDIDPCPITHRDWRVPRPQALSGFAGKHALHSQDYLTAPPREVSDRELLAVATQMAREKLYADIDAVIAELKLTKALLRTLSHKDSK